MMLLVTTFNRDITKGRYRSKLYVYKPVAKNEGRDDFFYQLGKPLTKPPSLKKEEEKTPSLYL